MEGGMGTGARGRHGRSGGMTMDNDVKNTIEKPDFRKLVEPLIEYIRKNYHPHTRIIIDFDSAEIVVGVKGELFEYFDD